MSNRAVLGQTFWLAVLQKKNCKQFRLFKAKFRNFAEQILPDIESDKNLRKFGVIHKLRQTKGWMGSK